MQHFLCKWALELKTICYGIWGYISVVLLQKCLQVSSLCPWPQFCTNPMHHPHSITLVGAIHLEYEMGDTSSSCTMWRYFLMCSLGLSCSSLSSVSLVTQWALPIKWQAPAHTFYSFACTLTYRQDGKREESYISLCDQQGSCYELGKFYNTIEST